MTKDTLERTVDKELHPKVIEKPATEDDIPAEFQVVTIGDLPPDHDFKKVAICTGLVLQVKALTIGEGKKANDTMFMIIQTATERTTVWRSAALFDIFAVVKPNDEIYIKYKGEVKTRNGLNDMKQFATGIIPGNPVDVTE